MSVRANLAVVGRRIRDAGGDPERITLVAVTKGFGPAVARAAFEAGLHDLGESYAQELLLKAPAIGASNDDVRWHFLGPVQRNKVAALASPALPGPAGPEGHRHGPAGPEGRRHGLVSCWHSVDRFAVGEAIARRQPGARILVQVNATGEASKHGCLASDTVGLVAQLRRLDLDVAGLMTIGPTGPPELARPVFRQVATLGRQLDLAELSMGMTGDLEVAIQEGATMVRIGRGLFGPRDRAGVACDGRLVNGGD
jgi:uncharacterized pyridoxal phosphate-containing UPF0001 family protein